MIHAKQLLADLQIQHRKLTEDLRQQIGRLPEQKSALQAEYQAAKDAERTAETFNAWCEEYITQAAVAWLLSCVFLRFIEDNQLIAEPLLAGPGDRNRLAREAARVYFAEHPTENERHYLEHCFGQLAEFPALALLFDSAHNPLYRLPPSYDYAKALVDFWQRVDPDTGSLAHDFTDAELDTRFLGDLYQDLSEAARKRYALLQTPVFVEEFILDRTLDPAIETFGLETVRMIDPTCGSGHFLLGALQRLLDHWERSAPGLDIRQRVNASLGAVHGVDLNPFAVAIARFRLLVAALQATGIQTIREAPAWKFNVTAGDSLLHGRRFGELDLGGDMLGADFEHVYFAEDRAEVDRILGQQYHVVVGNPPYPAVKDAALSQLYRTRYKSCHGLYSIAVPFTERFFQLTMPEIKGYSPGFIGMITANSFTKREFGKKLVEEYLVRQDLTHIIDTSGAHIPGHGTPTVIIFGRHRNPISDTMRMVLGIRGEPGKPADPSMGKVWNGITTFIDLPNHGNEFVNVVDTPRKKLASHPWSLQGGNAPRVKTQIENTEKTLDSFVSAIGPKCITKQDDIFSQPLHVLQKSECEANYARKFVVGEDVRDWCITDKSYVIFPYEDDIRTVDQKKIAKTIRFMWPYKASLFSRKVFGGKNYRDVGKPWYEFGQIPADRFLGDLSLVFAFVSTHNHFVLDRAGKVSKQTAPVIKLPLRSTQSQYLGLLGLLNSSTACFWLKQNCFNKGQGETVWADRYEHDASKVRQFPVSASMPDVISASLDEVARAFSASQPHSFITELPLSREAMDEKRETALILRGKMIALQEELDWWCYHAYSLVDEDFTYSGILPELALGKRAFEIFLARRIEAGEADDSWFQKHGSSPITDLPADWPDDYRTLIERRIEVITSNEWIGLLERPEYKRRWNQPSWDELEQTALREWLLERLEAPAFWPEQQLQNIASLAARAERDEDFMAVAGLYTGEAGFDVAALIQKLVADETVPAIAAMRYKASGLRKRLDWEETWELQRKEDAIDAGVLSEVEREADEPEEEWHRRIAREQTSRKHAEVGDIPAPPKYKAADFLNSTYWGLRGGLDVPRERFYSVPDGGQAGQWFYGWAGWNPVQRAQALAGAYMDAETRQGWNVQQLTPLLAAVQELLPWVLQWHNDMDAEFGVRLGDYFRDWVNGELHKHSLTRDDLLNWRPPAAQRRGRRRAS